MSKYDANIDTLVKCLESIKREITFTYKIDRTLQDSAYISINGCVESVLYLLRDFTCTSDWKIHRMYRSLSVEF